jgi:hypothetical protein
MISEYVKLIFAHIRMGFSALGPASDHESLSG